MYSRIKRRQFNNDQGSALLTVIVCLVLLALLGSLLVSASLTNYRMKVIESGEMSNFYTCETAMEEIRTGLQELTAQTIRSVYEDRVLTFYSFYAEKAEEEVNALIQEEVANLLMDSLTLEYEAMLEGHVPFRTYLSSLAEGEAIQRKVRFDGAQLREEDTGKSVILKDVTVDYIRDGYETTITSDIRIKLPAFSFRSEDETSDYIVLNPLDGYVLAADGGILSDNYMGSTNVTGSVYSNDGITVRSQAGGTHSLRIGGNDCSIVTRGDIAVEDAGKLIVGDITMDEDRNVILGTGPRPIIWASSLMTGMSGPASLFEAIRPAMYINGIIIAKDDLALNAKNSEVILAGSYIGYSGVNTAEGSAMMINGSGSSLNLSGLTSLVLGGRAHVVVEKPSEDPEFNLRKDIMTGESLSIKSNQRAYLIPGEFLEEVLHNPVAWQDYEAIAGAPKVTIPDEAYGINYLKYLDAGSPYRIAAGQTLGSDGSVSTLLYYYLNFGSGKKADSYLMEYARNHSKVLQEMSPFTLKEVKLPEVDAIYSVGNLVSFKSTSEDGHRLELIPGISKDYPEDVSDEMIYQRILDLTLGGTDADGLDPEAYGTTALNGCRIAELSRMYSTVTHLLSIDRNKAYHEGDMAVASIINPEGLVRAFTDIEAPDFIRRENYEYITYSGTAPYLWERGDIGKNVILLAESDIVVKSDFKGFLLATGSITVESSVSIQGMMLSLGEGEATSLDDGTEFSGIIFEDGTELSGQAVSGKDIILGSGSNLHCDGSDRDYLSELFREEGRILGYLFENMDIMVRLSSSAPGYVDLLHMISYENWRKY